MGEAGGETVRHGAGQPRSDIDEGTGAKLVFHILRESLTSLRAHWKGVSINGLVVLIVLVGFNVLFPVDPIGGQEASRSDSNLNMFFEMTSYGLFVPAFMVYAHRHILHPDSLPSGWFALRFKLTELRLLLYGAAITLVAVSA